MGIESLLFIKQWEAFHRMITEFMRGQNGLTCLCQFRSIVRMDSKQRFTFFHLISHLVMDDKTDSVVHRIGFLRPPGAEYHRCLAHTPCLDLSHVTVSGRF